MEKGPGVKQIDGSVVSWKPEQIALMADDQLLVWPIGLPLRYVKGRQGQHQKYNNFHILEKYYFKDLIPDGGGSGTCSPWQGTRSAWTGPKRTLSGPPSQS
ncbi:hypothetical protein JHK87_016025 [Glycine soja]|nr:hypothetical protein JHK87_016025 [Glycine soja]